MLASVLLFFDVSGGEIMVIMLFVLMFFGSKKIPELARGLGKGMREFQDASNGIRREIQNEANKLRDEASKIQKDVRSETSLDQLLDEAPANEAPVMGAPVAQQTLAAETPAAPENEIVAPVVNQTNEASPIPPQTL
jgi:sec-independent protein translocase protein TatA